MGEGGEDAEGVGSVDILVSKRERSGHLVYGYVGVGQL
jgi:hypothetical protein